MQRSSGYIGVRNQFLTSVAISFKNVNKEILIKLLALGKEEEYWMHCYPLLEAKLKMKPEAYFEKMDVLIKKEAFFIIDDEELNYLNEQIKRYPPEVEKLRRTMIEVFREQATRTA